MIRQEKYEPVFELIKSMSKAEKRNFKLYATRLAGNQDAKFITLFDHLESAEEYDEKRIIEKCPIKKEQLPNMKAHLHKQIMVSLRLLNVQRSESMQLREQLDFAKILYDKGLYKQSIRVLEKVHTQAEELCQYTILLDTIQFEQQIETLHISKGTSAKADTFHTQADAVSHKIEMINNLSSISLQLYSLYHKLGYARTQKDLDLITTYFLPRLELYANMKLSFPERFYYYQAMAWYHYIRHDFVHSYKYACLWVALFDSDPKMKVQMYDNYLKGYSRILEGLFLMRKYNYFVVRLEKFEREHQMIGAVNDNALLISGQILYTNLIHRHFMEGTFAEGVKIVPQVDEFIEYFSKHIPIHEKMLIYYKIACLYFGNDNYTKCMEYLGRITSTKDPQIRRDLQCYARMLNLISSYEAGLDHNLDYQIRSLYAFLIKMNDMNQVQRVLMSFLKKIGSMYEEDLRGELKNLYERLLPYESHTYLRRTFYYLDLISWLESKIMNQPVANIIHQKFLRSQK